MLLCKFGPQVHAAVLLCAGVEQQGKSKLAERHMLQCSMVQATHCCLCRRLASKRQQKSIEQVFHISKERQIL